jgi:hypothetical protein
VRLAVRRSTYVVSTRNKLRNFVSTTRQWTSGAGSCSPCWPIAKWNHGVVSACIDAALLDHFYERLADHAVEIRHRVIFMASGGWTGLRAVSGWQVGGWQQLVLPERTARTRDIVDLPQCSWPVRHPT